MEAILSTIAKSVPHNEPRDLLARLYREIGISAVAAALQISDAAPKAGSDAAATRIALPAAEAA